MKINFLGRRTGDVFYAAETFRIEIVGSKIRFTHNNLVVGEADYTLIGIGPALIILGQYVQAYENKADTEPV